MKNLNLKLWLCAIMLCAVTGVNAYDAKIDGIYYNLDTSKGTASVTYYSAESYYYYNYDAYSSGVTIPESVTYKDNSYNVTSIDGHAFHKCSGLTSVTIPESITSIGENAFYGCSGLTKVEFANIKHYLNDIYFDGGFGSSANPLSIAHHLYIGGEEVKDLVIPESVTSIGDNAFYKCSSLNSVTIPNSVTSIGNYAFWGCSGLTSVTIPNSVTSIGNYAFWECSGLTSVTIGNGVTSIGEHAFWGCSGLTSVTIPNSVTSIGQYAFRWCSGLTSIVVESGNTKYDSRENCNALIETVSNTLIQGSNNTVIPESVTSIGYEAFYGCSGLTSVSIPNSVTSIGEKAFYNCSGLTKVEFANIKHYLNDIYFDGGFGSSANPLSIAHHLYIGGEEVKDLVILESVTSIGDNAFYKCSGLTSVSIPNSVTSIGNDAFRDCSSLNSVTIGNSVASIGESAFSGCKLRNLAVRRATPPRSSTNSFSEQTQYHTTLYIPMGAWDAYAYDNAWYKFINIRETASGQNEVKADIAYTLMDAKTFEYAVYDAVNDRVRMVASVNVDESDPNHCWQTVEMDGKSYLYNIGAKKFAVPATDGSSFTLSDTVGSVTMTDSEDGIVLGGNANWQWALVVDEKIDAYLGLEDVVATGVLPVDNGQLTMDNAKGVYDLSGRKMNVNDNVNVNNSKFEIQNSKLRKGIYVVNGKKLLKR